MSNEEENDYILKIHLVGNSSAGKLPLLNRLTKGVLENAKKYYSTIGVEFVSFFY